MLLFMRSILFGKNIIKVLAICKSQIFLILTHYTIQNALYLRICYMVL